MLDLVPSIRDSINAHKGDPKCAWTATAESILGHRNRRNAGDMQIDWRGSCLIAPTSSS